jgi:alanyl-tRNA synthetase
MKTNELREKYLAFFQTKGHTRCASDVLVPTWDPSVLFTPAGMNQFKDHFLGKVKLEFTRATSCQKCLRTGDIDKVGRTAYHHTFFEMLGNFSFGDYFKREAINWAWEFLTRKEWLGIDPSRLSVSVYKDDDEAADIWREDIGLSADRIERLGEDENFWPASAPSQGPDGVCGPCSEIFYHDQQGGSVEIWNLVFTQFNRVGDSPDNLRPLPSKNIDTGMGLERAAATLQGVSTNFHIDILRPIVDAAAEICQIPYQQDTEDGRRLRRITDHIRACTMAIHENVYPGPQKEKYVVRRLLRRAVLDGHQMGVRQPFLYRVVPTVVEMMSLPYPELGETAQRVADVIRKEEENFFGTIDAGLARVEKIFTGMKRAHRTTVDGGEAAELYQTYGVPPEVFESVAAENNLAFDWEGFRRAMQEHGEASGTVVHAVMGDRGPLDAIKRVLHATHFVGYDTMCADAELKFIVAQNQLCEHLKEASRQSDVIVVLDRSPFYGESGGQVGDTGEIVGEGFRFQVSDTQKDGSLLLHHGHLTEGELRAGVAVTAQVDGRRRHAIRRAHSATHLLHHALQKNLGRHAQQQGSKVDDDWLRFDFTNMSPVAADQLEAIESDVHQKVEAHEPIRWDVVPLAEARKAGAMMLFGEKYPDPVRMVSMGNFSKELCGGTHLDDTSQVQSFEIVSEEGIAAGTRRIVALTGAKAAEHIENTKRALEEAATTLGVSPHQVAFAARSLAETVRDLKKQRTSGSAAPRQAGPSRPAGSDRSLPYTEMRKVLRETARVLNVSPFDVPARLVALRSDAEKLRQQLAERQSAGMVTADSLLALAEEVDGIRVIVAEAAGADANLMRSLVDQLRKAASPCAVLLASREAEDKVTLVAGLSRELVERGASAGNWVREVAPVLGGGGGGRADMAQAGGRDPDKMPEALNLARQTIKGALGRSRLADGTC